MKSDLFRLGKAGKDVPVVVNAGQTGVGGVLLIQGSSHCFSLASEHPPPRNPNAHGDSHQPLMDRNVPQYMAKYMHIAAQRRYRVPYYLLASARLGPFLPL